MATKRSFSEKVTGSDAFAELSFEAQALYMHLCMNADDNGFIATPGRIRKGVGASVEAMSELEGSGYIAMTEDGACAIIHWSWHTSDKYHGVEDCDERVKKSSRERVRRYRARKKEQEETTYEDSCGEDVTACNGDVTACNALQSVTCNADVTAVTLHTVTNPSPFSSPPLFPLSSFPQTPIYYT
ncbi:MAG: hypothetical protein E7609_08030, partial [Ruminococcaceae bacterium]|nr:hypothetical protein [Oscillospiraceae bacterium]